MRVVDEQERSGWPQCRLFGFVVDIPTPERAADAIFQAIEEQRRVGVAFLNAHCINVSQSDPRYRRALARATYRFADGSGMRIAARAAGRPHIPNVNGTDLFPVLCERAAARGTKLFLFGARPGVAEEVAERMASRTPGLLIVGTADGYRVRYKSDIELTRAIEDSGAEMVLVALGVPNQETWIDRHRAMLSAPVLIGVGGLFDFYSGRKPRAPLVMRQLGLEWLWRLALEPRRLWRRYLIGNARFLARLVWQGLFAPANFARDTGSGPDEAKPLTTRRWAGARSRQRVGQRP